MSVLFLGIFLWVAGHLYGRLAPERRAAMGRGPIALTITLGLLCMVLGYLQAPYSPLWDPPGWGRPVNNGLMLVAVWLFGVAKVPGVLRSHLRHPMLSGVLLWAVAHLLVAGDLAGVVLFAAMGIWAVVQMVLINAGPGWTRPAPGRIAADLGALVVAAVLYGAIGWVHILLGRQPFGA